MTPPTSTITQDEYDALKITLAARDAEIERLRDLLREVSTYFHGAIKHNILKAIDLALDELILPEDTKVMLTTGKDGDMVAKSKDGGLTWTYVLYEKHRAEALVKPNTKVQIDPLSNPEG